MEYEAKKRSEGMSAAEAKRSVSAKPANEDIPRKPEASECGRVPEPAVACHDSVIDGKAEKASYNPGAEEHIVHVTEIRKNENDTVREFQKNNLPFPNNIIL